jgi:hypothetical protein
LPSSPTAIGPWSESLRPWQRSSAAPWRRSR